MKALKFWWLIFVLPVVIALMVTSIALVPNNPLRKVAGMLVCPSGSILKVTASDTTWYEDGLTRQGTGYSFDCVNVSGAHVENKIDTVFTVLLLAAILSPFVIVLARVFAPQKQVKHESMYDGKMKVG